MVGHHAAVQGVLARFTRHPVTSGTTGYTVVTRAAIQPVVARIADQRIVTTISVEFVGAIAANQRVVFDRTVGHFNVAQGVGKSITVGCHARL